MGKRPGAIATSRMPCAPHSTARLRVIACKPALAMADGTVKARPVRTDVDRMLSTTPAWAWPVLAAASIQRRPTPTVQYSAPCRLVASTASIARGDKRSVCAMKVAAALLTSACSGARAHTPSSIASTWAASRMSQRCSSTAAAPSTSSRAALACSTSSRRPHSTRWAPRPAKRSAITAPSPVPPPVMRMRLPANKSVRNMVDAAFNGVGMVSATVGCWGTRRENRRDSHRPSRWRSRRPSRRPSRQESRQETPAGAGFQSAAPGR